MIDLFESQFKEELSEININLSKEQCKQFFKFYELLIEWNKVMNLTAITEIRDVITKHFVDSLSLIKAIPDLDDNRYKIIDVGTGAGFPGLPLKIMFPGLQVTLLDSLNKRIVFLNEVISDLGLIGIDTIHGRAEDFGQNKEFREIYDLSVSRAVANLSTLSEYCVPFLRTGGLFVSYKLGNMGEELEVGKKTIKKFDCKIEDVISFKLENLDERCLIKIRKNGILNKKYPRKAGMPSKEPL